MADLVFTLYGIDPATNKKTVIDIAEANPRYNCKWYRRFRLAVEQGADGATHFTVGRVRTDYRTHRVAVSKLFGAIKNG